MNNQPLITTASFKLGVFGTHITQEFSTRIEKLGLSHKQVGLLAIVDAGLANSQRDIATQLGIAPSLVVALADQLVERGAITRARSTTDRRNYCTNALPSRTNSTKKSARASAPKPKQPSTYCSPKSPDSNIRTSFFDAVARNDSSISSATSTQSVSSVNRNPTQPRGPI